MEKRHKNLVIFCFNPTPLQTKTTTTTKRFSNASDAVGSRVCLECAGYRFQNSTFLCLGKTPSLRLKVDFAHLEKAETQVNEFVPLPPVTQTTKNKELIRPSSPLSVSS